MHEPDKWLIFRHTDTDGKIYHRVFGSWAGGYLDSDSWRLNSGIVSVLHEDNHYIFVGYSGSRYRCRVDAYGATAYGAFVANSFDEQYSELEILTEEAAKTFIAGFLTAVVLDSDE